jgi:hypothetical protein
MKNKLSAFLKFGALSALVMPFLVSAQSATCAGPWVEVMLCRISLWLNTLVPILIVVGVLYFIWGVIQFVIASSEEAKTKGRDTMIYGLIGLLVITSVWGLVTILKNTFSISDQTTISVPCIEAAGVDCPQSTP